MKEFQDEVAERAERFARNAKDIADEIGRRRQEAEKNGLEFTSLTPEQLEEKLARANSPMIVYQAWNGGAPQGGAIDYHVGISNPDPIDQIWLFVHLFVGPANVATDMSEALTAVDRQFPRLTMPKFAGLTIKAGATEQLDFKFAVPAQAAKSNYLGNSFLFQSTWHDPGVYLDRSLFVFEVT
jgi:hypothetical protein